MLHKIFLTPSFQNYICWCNEESPWEKSSSLPLCLPPFLPSPPAPSGLLPSFPPGLCCSWGGGCSRAGLRGTSGGWTQGAVTAVLMNCTDSCCHGERADFFPLSHPTVPWDQHRKLIVLCHASSGSSSGCRATTKLARGIFSCWFRSICLEICQPREAGWTGCLVWGESDLAVQQPLGLALLYPRITLWI